MTDDDRARIAAARFTPTADGRLPTLEELAKRYSVRRLTIQQAVAAAIRQQLVQVRVVPGPPKSDRDTALEEQLKTSFGLQAALVLDCRRNRGLSFDDIQAHIGWLMGRWIADSADHIFRPDLFAVVATGRAVRSAVTALRNYAPVGRWPGAAAGSLCGSVGEKPAVSPIDRENVLLDADSIATNFCCCIGPAPRLFLMAQPISTDGGAKEGLTDRDVLARTWLEHDWRPPDIGLIGISGFTRDHRFVGCTEPGKTEHFLEPIAKDIRNLAALVEKLELKSTLYCPVAVMCHRPFWVDPPPEFESRVARVESSVRKLIERINQRIVSVKLERLSDIKNVYLVGGGAGKARAIYHVLTDRERPIKVRVLATDSNTADAILAWKNTDRSGEPRSNGAP